jgi:hypothetical protein
MVYRSSSNIVAEQRKRFQNTAQSQLERTPVSPSNSSNSVTSSRRTSSTQISPAETKTVRRLGASSRPPLPSNIQLRADDLNAQSDDASNLASDIRGTGHDHSAVEPSCFRSEMKWGTIASNAALGPQASSSLYATSSHSESTGLSGCGSETSDVSDLALVLPCSNLMNINSWE